eukprot:Gb_34498 [translate_table: standard]
MDSFMLFPSGGLGIVVYLAVAFVFIHALYRSFCPSLKLPPGPPGWPIIGHLHLLGSHPHRSLDRISKAYSPIMKLRLGSRLVVVGSSVEMARELLKTHDLTFASRPKTAAGKYTLFNYSNITWSPYGAYWRQARKICLMELFNGQRLESFKYIRVEEVSSMLASVFQTCGRGLPVNLREDLSTVSCNIICRMVFGRRYLDEDAGHKIRPHEFKEMVNELFVLNGVFNIGDYIPWLSWLDLQGYVKRMKECNRRFDIFLEEVLEEHNAQRNGVENFVAKDMVDVLLQLADDPGLEVKLSRNSVKAFTLDMIAGGTETSATLMEWGIAELLRKPEGLKKAAEEMERVVGRERWIEEKDIPELPFLQAIVKETMRLHPAVPMLVPRLSREACRIGGYDIPANTTVFVNVWTIARDESLWENPTEFWPERFEGRTIDIKGRDFELLPFGSGRRMCPGYTLGLKVVQLGLANLIHGFNWRLPANRCTKDLDMWETYGLTTPKAHPLVAVAEPRLPSHLYASLSTKLK